jgi:hypothetical protein
MNSPYAKFVKENGYTNNDSARALFIKKNKVDYLIWHKSLPVPDGLEVSKIIIDDNVDYKIIKLKYSTGQ